MEAGSLSLDDQIIGARTIRSKNEVTYLCQTLLFRNQTSGGAVTKDAPIALVIRMEVFGISLRRQQKDIGCQAGRYQAFGNSHPVNASRAAEVIVKGAGRCWDSQTVLQDTGSRRKTIVWTLGTKKEEIDVRRGNLILLKQLQSGLLGQITSRLSLSC